MMIRNCLRLVFVSALFLITAGCSNIPKVAEWVSEDHLPQKLAVYDGVFWGTGAVNFRDFIATSNLFKEKTVYDIGTGTGIYALLAMQAGSKYVVATDIDPKAVKNAKLNAKIFGWADKIDARLVPESNTTAYSALKENERFDIIVSNPPWFGYTPDTVRSPTARHFTDEGFQLIDSLIKDMRNHLNPGGAAYLAIGNTEAIVLIENLAATYQLKMEILDEKTNTAYIEAIAQPSDSSGFFIPAAILKISAL